MNLHRLLQTSVIRLALKYALFNAMLIAMGLGFLFWATSQYVDAQIEAGLQHELAKLTDIDTSQGRKKLVALLNSEWQKGLEGRRYNLLISKDGEQLAGELRGWPTQLDADGQVQNIWIEDDLTPYNVEDHDGYWPMIGGTLKDGSRLLITQSVLPAEDLQEFTLSVMAIILILSIGLALAMGWFLGRTILARIDNINTTAKAITTGDLTQRVTLTEKDDEFDELGNHLNAMLTRIEQLMASMRQVTDNVAHDLRRPLSRLRNRLEVTLLETRDAEEYRNVIQETIVDAESLISTFNALLEIAQTEAASFRGEWTSVNLSNLAHELGGLYSDLAEEKGKRFTIEAGSNIEVVGNRHLLAQALNNLLDNAIKYTPDKGLIKLHVAIINDRPTIIVSDNGPGIPPDQYQTVLERYTRLDTARSTEGNGLGLSLIKAVAELHHARLKLEDNLPGLRVVLSFSENENDLNDEAKQFKPTE